MSEAAVARERTTTAALTLRTLLTSSAIFLVAGLLGGALRQSQAGIETLSPSTWYAIMTAHGLAAFVGWAGFALMGASWWVLEESGFPLRGPGLALARDVLLDDGDRRRRRRGDDARDGVRRLVGLSLPLAVLWRCAVDGD